MKCNDQSVLYLKSFGYNVVRLPNANISPLQVLMKNGSMLESLGEISSVLVRGEAKGIPIIKKDIPTASISGQRTSDLSIGVGLTILGNILGAMGGGNLGLKTEYKNAKTVAFEFKDVLTDMIDIVLLDQYLNDADIDPNSQHIRTLLESDDIYIVTSVIKSKSFKVQASDSYKKAIEVDASAIKEICGPSVKVAVGSNIANALDFSGETALIFGFKAIRLIYEDGKYSAFDTVRMNVPMGIDENLSKEPGKVEWLQTSDNMVDFSTPEVLQD